MKSATYCARCGGPLGVSSITYQGVEFCSTSCVPPHAAGEEIPTDTIGAVGLEFCGSWIELTRYEWALCAEVARLRALVSPAASQTVPESEIPGWVTVEVQFAQHARARKSPMGAIVWLADRVKELEPQSDTQRGMIEELEYHKQQLQQSLSDMGPVRQQLLGRVAELENHLATYKEAHRQDTEIIDELERELERREAFAREAARQVQEHLHAR